MIELERDQLHIASTLYRDYPYLHGYAASALSGEMGTVAVDNLECPVVGPYHAGLGEHLGWRCDSSGGAGTVGRDSAEYYIDSRKFQMGGCILREMGASPGKVEAGNVQAGNVQAGLLERRKVWRL